MTCWGIHSSFLPISLYHQQWQILSFFKITSEVSMQFLVSRSLEIQGNSFRAKSQVLMTVWQVMMIIHSGCTLSSVFHLEKQGCAGNPCEENQTPKVILVGWKDLNELFTSHVIYPSVLPDLHGNVYGVLLTPGQSIKMFRGGEHLSFSSTSLCLLIDNCHEKYFCEQLLALGNRLN